MPSSKKKKILWVLIFVLLFLGGIAGGFFYFSKSFAPKQLAPAAPTDEKQVEEGSFIRVYYPSGGRLVMEERRVKRQDSLSVMAEGIIGEFLRAGSAQARSDVPQGTKLLGVFHGIDGILYIDFSDEFRRNFQGDALTEFLLLKALYDSIISNMTGVDDVKVLIEGKEIESIGGHFFALYPLKNIVAGAR
jgi:spore germination protein GerM